MLPITILDTPHHQLDKQEGVDQIKLSVGMLVIMLN